MNLDEFKAWLHAPAKRRGKPITNAYYYMESMVMMAIMLMLIALVGFLVNGYRSVIIPETICTAIAPEGFHEIDFDYANKTCTFANDTNIIVANYIYDSANNKYWLYEVKP